jgi:hypothetical protein
MLEAYATTCFHSQYDAFEFYLYYYITILTILTAQYYSIV